MGPCCTKEPLTTPEPEHKQEKRSGKLALSNSFKIIRNAGFLN